MSSYESELKSVLEELAWAVVNDVDRSILHELMMPVNVAGVEPISLADWMLARNKKRGSNDV